MARQKKTATVQIHNSTPWGRKTIEQFPHLGTAYNTYHKQVTTLYAHPSSDSLLVAVVQGPWLVSLTIETRRAYTLALDAAARGHVYLSA